MTSNGSYPIIQAVAVPVPDDDNLSPNYDFRAQMKKKQSSYMLPRGYSVKKIIDENAINALIEQGYTNGLARSLSENNTRFPLRIWVVDNSGSMQNTDGKRIISTKKSNVKFVTSTRWAELKECISYHTQMAALLKTPTVFRLLNNPGIMKDGQQFSIAENSTSETDIMRDVQNATSIMNKVRPAGVTPLIAHILEIKEAVQDMADKLYKEGQRVAIIIATDGLPTDDQGYFGKLVNEQFIGALRLLEGLPVWVVVRLCTDDEDVVDFYNGLDDQLELSVDVLDDFEGEAEEINSHNPWLNYALPLHRCREMGYHDRLFDLLDERLLTKEELRDFCALLFGDFDDVPNPEEDWDGFYEKLKKLSREAPKQWNPITKKLDPWIDTTKLKNSYAPSAACILM